MKSVKLPTRQQCYEIIEQYYVPSNIVKHCEAVAQFGCSIGAELCENGVDVNLPLVERAGLLHDVLRICDCKTIDVGKLGGEVSDEQMRRWSELKQEFDGLCHEYAAYKLFKDSYPELAMVIKTHKYRDIADEKKRPVSWEQKIVYYADKRVMHDKVVSLRERLEDGHSRNTFGYHSNPEAREEVQKIDNFIFELEEEIFRSCDRRF